MAKRIKIGGDGGLTLDERVRLNDPNRKPTEEERLIKSINNSTPCETLDDVIKSPISIRVLNILLQNSGLFNKEYLVSLYERLILGNLLTAQESQDLRTFLFEVPSTKEKTQRVLDLISSGVNVAEKVPGLCESTVLGKLWCANNLLCEVGKYLSKNDSYGLDYDEISSFDSELFAYVKKDGLCGLIRKLDDKIVEIIPIKYVSVSREVFDLYLVKDFIGGRTLCGFVDGQSGTVLLEPTLSDCTIRPGRNLMFSKVLVGGSCTTSYPMKGGVIDSYKGKVLEDTRKYKKGLYYINNGIIKQLLDNEYDEIDYIEEFEDKGIVQFKKDGKIGIARIDGDNLEILLPCTLDSFFVRDGLILTKIGDKKGLYQIVDGKLICILETNYDKIEFDCEDLYIRMTINGKTGLMRRDENTKIWELFIEPLYERIGTIDFMNGLGIISDGNKEGLLKVFLNGTYKILCEPTYPEIGEIHIVGQDIYFFTQDAGYDYKGLIRIAENGRIDELISSNDKQYENIRLRKDGLFELIDRNKNISLHEIVENRLIKIFEMLGNEIGPFKTDGVANTTKLSRNGFIKRYSDGTIEELFSCEYGWHSRYIGDGIFMMESWDDSKFGLYQEEDRTIKKILPMKYDRIDFDLEKDFYLFSNGDKVGLLLKSDKNIFVAVTPKSKLSVVQISGKMYVEYKNIWGKLVKKSFDEFLKKFK